MKRFIDKKKEWENHHYYFVILLDKINAVNKSKRMV